MNYIKQLEFINENTGIKCTLEFKEGTNIIIGPKGGGKSTLLNLLYSLHSKSRLKSETKKALDVAGIKPISITYSNGVVTTIKELSNINDDDEIITQMDDLKTRLSDQKAIIEEKVEFINSIINTQASAIISMFEIYFQTFFNIYEIRKRNISWNLISNVTDENKRDYKISLLEKIKKNSALLSNSLKSHIVDNDAKSIAILQKYISINNGNNNHIISNFISEIDDIVKIHKNSAREQIILNSSCDTCKYLIDKLTTEIKQNSNKSSTIDMFKSSAKQLFTDFGIQIARNIIGFDHLMNNAISFHVKGTAPTKYNMEFSIDSNIKIEPNDVSFQEILSHSLFKAKKDSTRWTNWLYSSFENAEPTRVDANDLSIHVKSSLAKKVNDEIKILADGKDYQTMSLGTRTSYGLRQKINSIQSSFLFLDQPEDGIDSYTIYNTLIPLIENKMHKESQIFMVTHNANFGINSNTTSITTANFDNKDSVPYQQHFDLRTQTDFENIKDTPAAIYLEGGTSSLKKRHEKLTLDNINERKGVK
ncbi:MAG: hypothetical protein Ta2E_07300 [Mycoplasmoidaceae bacterium]|nr:MAG: hypothetical protein Ta2E_07300 [Mycoplasmoidaceae bacterium]